jgi:hypothetical protein
MEVATVSNDLAEMQNDGAQAANNAAPAPITVLEALATASFPTGPNMSNRTTPPAADADDQ